MSVGTFARYPTASFDVLQTLLMFQSLFSFYEVSKWNKLNHLQLLTISKARRNYPNDNYVHLLDTEMPSDLLLCICDQILRSTFIFSGQFRRLRATQTVRVIRWCSRQSAALTAETITLRVTPVARTSLASTIKRLLTYSNSMLIKEWSSDSNRSTYN